MARLYHAGAELDAAASTNNALNPAPDGDSSTTPKTSRDTSVFRSGLASWKSDSGAGGASCIANLGTSIIFADGTTYYIRGYFLSTTAPTTSTPMFQLAGSLIAQFRTDGALELRIAATPQGSPSATLINDGVWHRIEMKGVAVATGNWNSVELLLDGVSVTTWSGTQSRTSGPSWGWNGTPGASRIINIDDIALNDSTGATNNGYPGDGSVVLLKPTADSAVGTGWTNDQAATTGLSASVSAIPPAGIADTTTGGGGHLIRNATSNANSNYDATMTTYTAAGVPAGATINAVLPVTATSAPVATSAKAGTVGVVSNPTVTNVALGATGTAGAFWGGFAAGTYGTGWKWSNGTVAQAPTVTLGTAPVMRVTQVTASTRIADVCFMGIYVDYTPAAAAAPTPDIAMARFVT